jgi:hypothetical protein
MRPPGGFFRRLSIIDIGSRSSAHALLRSRLAGLQWRNLQPAKYAKNSSTVTFACRKIQKRSCIFTKNAADFDDLEATTPCGGTQIESRYWSDRAGVKPLYFIISGRFVFASESRRSSTGNHAGTQPGALYPT